MRASSDERVMIQTKPPPMATSPSLSMSRAPVSMVAITVPVRGSMRWATPSCSKAIQIEALPAAMMSALARRAVVDDLVCLRVDAVEFRLLGRCHPYGAGADGDALAWLRKGDLGFDGAALRCSA